MQTKKEYTPFGKFFSELRKERKETLEEAAAKLEVSVSYISSVEHGDRIVPSSWEQKIIDGYDLSEEKKAELHEAVMKSREGAKITIEEIRTALTNMAINMSNSEEERKLWLEKVDQMIGNLTKEVSKNNKK